MSVSPARPIVQKVLFRTRQERSMWKTHGVIARLTIVCSAAAAAMTLAAPAAAQTEAALKAYFEGRQVVTRIDLPGTAEGVDVKVDALRPVDYSEYGNRLKTFGTALRAGEQATITLVKVK